MSIAIVIGMMSIAIVIAALLQGHSVIQQLLPAFLTYIWLAFRLHQGHPTILQAGREVYRLAHA